MDSDMNQVKSLFNGSSSYAGMITSYAYKIANQANSQLSLARGSLYGSNGSYYLPFKSLPVNFSTIVTTSVIFYFLLV